MNCHYEAGEFKFMWTAVRAHQDSPTGAKRKEAANPSPTSWADRGQSSHSVAVAAHANIARQTRQSGLSIHNYHGRR